ncbi:HET domain-containing protein [Colletotrichum plurivorum]|uniref:HET domain-containing protein n=1 Tax=Colletotrichum plurivorum TaxID=2175906 RepID=A0A8H6MZD1_9PEZI|nr:HET domain-containing protein [Colletotrichum plurivorum]
MAPLTFNVHSCACCRRFDYDLRRGYGDHWPRATLREMRGEDGNMCPFFAMITDGWTMTLHRISDEAAIDLFGESVQLPSKNGGCTSLKFQDVPDVADLWDRISVKATVKGSDDSLGPVQKWLHLCLDKHPQCRLRGNQSFTPRRLVEISKRQNSTELRLVQTRETKVPLEYAALSYCWGGDQSLKLLSHNAKQLSRNLPLNALPATIRDAVTVCAVLEVSYLWVDALCIVQDDEVSKIEEIAEMASIYKHALVTICASSATSSSEGFLNPRRSPFANDQVFEFPCYSEKGVESSIFMGFLSTPTQPEEKGKDGQEKRGRSFVREQRKKEAARKNALTEPLDKRGWALQEKLLSNRTISFKRNQIQWECRGVPAGESWVDGFEADMDLQADAYSMPSAAPREDDPSWPSWKGQAMEAYEKMVVDYASRGLSLEVDRPLAISGIAREFAEMFGSSDQYVAGSWASKLLLRGLMWQRRRDLPESRRPKKYIGPSWSWTSLQCPIGHHLVPPKAIELGDITVSAGVVECFPRLRIESAPYGAVEEGTALVLKGKHISSWNTNLDAEPRQVTDGRGHTATMSTHASWYDVFDYDSDAEDCKNSEGRRYSRLELSTRGVERNANPEYLANPRVWGLILAAVEGREMTFTRLGCFECELFLDTVSLGETHLMESWWRKMKAEAVRSINPFNGATRAGLVKLARAAVSRQIRRLSMLAKARAEDSREVASWAREHRRAAKATKDQVLQAEATKDQVLQAEAAKELVLKAESAARGEQQTSQGTPPTPGTAPPAASTCAHKTTSLSKQAIPAVIPPVEEVSSTAAPVVAPPVQETPSTRIQTNPEAAKTDHDTTAREKLPDDVSSGNKTTSTRVKFPDGAGQNDRPQPRPEATCPSLQQKPESLKPAQIDLLKQGEKRMPTGPPCPERAAKREWGAMPDVQEIEPFNFKVDPGAATELWKKLQFLT